MTKLTNGDVTLDQDQYISTLRPITHDELTGAPADSPATTTVAGLFTSLRGAIAYTALTQDWIKVYIVGLQRIQHPKNIEVRRLNALTRKLRAEPKKLVYPAMTCQRSIDIHTDAGYRRMTGEDDETKGYGLRGANIIRRGKTKDGKPAIHLLDSVCKSHRLKIRSSYSAELLSSAHCYEDAYPTLITLHELDQGVVTTEKLKNIREQGGLKIEVTLTIDAESVYKSLTSKDIKVPTEKTLIGQIAWLREMIDLGLIHNVRWCDTRDMTADGHTKGSIDRRLLLQLMDGHHEFKYDVKTHTPYRPHLRTM